MSPVILITTTTISLLKKRWKQKLDQRVDDSLLSKLYLVLIIKKHHQTYLQDVKQDLINLAGQIVTWIFKCYLGNWQICVILVHLSIQNETNHVEICVTSQIFNSNKEETIYITKQWSTFNLSVNCFYFFTLCISWLKCRLLSRFWLFWPSLSWCSFLFYFNKFVFIKTWVLCIFQINVLW